MWHFSKASDHKSEDFFRDAFFAQQETLIFTKNGNEMTNFLLKNNLHSLQLRYCAISHSTKLIIQESYRFLAKVIFKA